MSLSDELCRSYLDLRWHFDPAAATADGVAAHETRLGRFDEAAIREHLAAARAIEAGIEELDLEDAADELDRTVLLDEVRAAIFRLQYERPHRRNPVFWIQHLCAALHGLLPENDEAAADRVEATLARLQGTPGFLAAAQATLGEPAAPLLDAAAELTGACRALVGELGSVIGPAAGEAGEELDAASKEAMEALNQFAVALDTDLRAHAGEHAPGIGGDEFERLLHHAHAIREGASELWRYMLHSEDEALAELARLGGGWRELVAFRLDDAAEADAVAVVRDELEQIRAFVDGAGILPSPPTGPVVAPLPAWLRPITGHAAYRRAISPRPPDTALLWVAPDAATAAWGSVVAAEFGVPGQHLLACYAARAPSEVRRRLGTWLTRGGWGLYAIDLLEEAGYWPDPEDRIMARAHLLVRLLLAKIDIGLHSRQLPVEEAVQSLRQAVPIAESTARALVRECLLEPTRAVGALVGRRELQRLRVDRLAPDDGRSLAQHHAEVLAFGAMPVPLIRWGMNLDE